MFYLNIIFWFIGICVCVVAVIALIGEIILTIADFIKRRKKNGKTKKIK